MTNYNYELSIIVPVYNVEKYIERCLNSIINIKDLTYEILLINDGSTDNSKSICEEYEKKYSKKIKLYNKSNGGLSDARNYGLSLAKGKYISFIDSDDFILADNFREIIKIAQINDVDIVTSDAYIYYDDGTFKRKTKRKKIKGIISGEDFLCRSIKSKCMSMAAPLSIFKMSIVKENKLKFKKGIIHEDQLWTPILYLKAKTVIYVDKIFYMHYQREGSIMHSNNKDKRVKDLINICYSLNEYYNNNLEIESNRRILNDYLVMLYLNAFFLGKMPKENSMTIKNKMKTLLFLCSPKLYYKINSLIKGIY